ncbi:hypothetical protein KBT16_18465 [Nostoc sp. CCCryo 231-06]|nr:hypothetical protein [Nostoc sp. CCCryo 231-06]
MTAAQIFCTSAPIELLDGDSTDSKGSKSSIVRKVYRFASKLHPSLQHFRRL